jgi:hypothetical protein
MATRPTTPASPAPTFSAPLAMRGPVVAGGAVGVIGAPGTPPVGAGAPGAGVVVTGTGAGVGGVPGTGVTVTTGMV